MFERWSASRMHSLIRTIMAAPITDPEETGGWVDGEDLDEDDRRVRRKPPKRDRREATIEQL